MYILGINCFYHDSAACLINDGKIIAAVEEERFNKEKHTKKFPVNAIKYCLKEAGITINDIDYIGYSYNPWLRIKSAVPYFLKLFPKSFNLLKSGVLTSETSSLGIVKTIKKKFGIEKPKFKFRYIEHHPSHSASSFFVSPFKEAAILTIDACGEIYTTWFGEGKNNKIECIKRINLPHSLGFVYSAITQYLGFKVNDEWKVMGLAPYGKLRYYREFKNLIKLKPNGEFRINTKYFDFQYGKKIWYSKKLLDLFGPARIPESGIKEKYKDIAASLQKRYEDIVMHMVNYLYKVTKSENLCLAGGCALNSVANGKILKESKFKEIFIQPAANDAGTSLGVAFYIYNQILNKPRNYVMDNVYLGPEYNDKQIKKALDDFNLNYIKCKDIAKECAKLIAKGKILGWFQGRMEFGPRALGNRSIIVDPRRAEMKDIINAKVKYRESFRPFAPAILEEDCNKYFELSYPSPYMLFVYEILPKKRKNIPAVTHVDGTGRLQTVSKKTNPLFWNLINEFKKLTKVSVVLNTSFNIRGEPIVCNPSDAIKCFRKTGIDCLALGKYLVVKQ